MKTMRKALLVILSAALLLGVAFATLASAYTPTEDMPNSAANADLMSGDTVIGKSHINRFEDQQVYTTQRLDGYNYTIGRKGTYANGYTAAASKMNTHQTVTEIAADGTADAVAKIKACKRIDKTARAEPISAKISSAVLGALIAWA